MCIFLKNESSIKEWILYIFLKWNKINFFLFIDINKLILLKIFLFLFFYVYYYIIDYFKCFNINKFLIIVKIEIKVGKFIFYVLYIIYFLKIDKGNLLFLNRGCINYINSNWWIIVKFFYKYFF